MTIDTAYPEPTAEAMNRRWVPVIDIYLPLAVEMVARIIDSAGRALPGRMLVVTTESDTPEVMRVGYWAEVQP